mgnify:CR=1 FL=1
MLLFAVAALALLALPLVAQHFGQGWVRIMALALLYVMLALGLKIEQIVPMVTSNPAKMCGMENEIGTLEVGKLADLAVLSADYLTIPVNEVGNLQSLLTMVGGKIVYSAAPF